MTATGGKNRKESNVANEKKEKRKERLWIFCALASIKLIRLA